MARNRARQALEELFPPVWGGSGRAALLFGAPGMGKSSLLQHARIAAEKRGALVLTASASQAEQLLPLSVVHQLLSGAALSPSQSSMLTGILHAAAELPADRWTTTPLSPDVAPVLHDIHNLFLGLTERAPLVLVVDEAQASDPVSLAYLLYLLPRIGTTKVLAVLSENSADPVVESRRVAEFVRNPHCRLLHLAPLSLGDTAAFVGQGRTTMSEHLVRSLHTMAGGSPLLLKALLADMADASPRERSGDGAPVAGRSFHLSVRYLLNRLESPVPDVARSMALLGAEATRDRIGRLLALPDEAVERAITTLQATGLAEGTRYRANSTSDAVVAGMTADEQAIALRRTARFLYKEGAPATLVARLLLRAGEIRDDWARPVLREAAEEALLRHDVRQAQACLRAAQAGCVSDRERAELRAEIAQAEWSANPRQAARYLTALVQDYRAGRLAEQHSLRLATHLIWHGRPDTAAEVLVGLSAAEDPRARPSGTRLQTVSGWFRCLYPGRPISLSRPGPDGSTPPPGVGDPYAEGGALLAGLRTGRERVEVLKDAELLLQSRSHETPVTVLLAALFAFLRHASLHQASRWCDILIQEVKNRPPVARALISAVAAAAEGSLGNHDGARRHSNTAFALLPPSAWGIAIGLPLSAKAVAALGRKDLRTADECFAMPVPTMMFQSVFGLHHLYGRGLHHLSRARFHAALRDLHACRDLMAAWNLDLSPTLRWQEPAAHALHALGRTDEADRLLPTASAPARSGHLGLLPASLRRADPGKTRRITPSHGSPTPDALLALLTRAERRVVRLTAQGHTNRKIAELLFITTSTVEQHLTHSYQKLGVGGRKDLAALLGSAPLPERPGASGVTTRAAERR